MKKYLAHFIAVIACSFSVLAADDQIEITKPALGFEPPIPISISGFSGEAESVLKFDLYVTGFSFVPASEAQYQLSGSSNGRVEGRLSQGGKNIFARAYNGASTRSQAHALADDIVKQIRGTAPIFRGKIAYRVNNGGNVELAVSDVDGHNASLITHDNSLIATPTWVGHEFKLMYSSWKNGGTQIFEHDLSSGGRRVFGHTAGSSYSPSVSPDGRKVAFISNRGGSPNLYVCDINGENVKQLTSTRDEASSPSWSPDSQHLIFATRAGRASLTKISINGGAPQKLRVAGAFGNLTEPDWSPDGRSIVFTCGSGSFSICVVPSTGGDAKILVDGEDPCWAPNSRTVIFTRRANGKRVLSLLDVPTKHVKDCIQNSGSCSQPAWAR
jgi:TolB protein